MNFEQYNNIKAPVESDFVSFKIHMDRQLVLNLHPKNDFKELHNSLGLGNFCTESDDIEQITKLTELILNRKGYAYEKSFDSASYNNALNEYKAKNAEIEANFKNDLFEHLGIKEHSKRERVFEIAMKYNACNDYEGRYSSAKELVELMAG